jgi:hypothetical protein
MVMLEAVFKCGYAGGVDYLVAGRKYHVRYFASTIMAYNTGVLEQKVAEVGTVRSDESDRWHDFPPPEVVALFPGFVGARFTRDYQYEYAGEQPELIVDPVVTYHVTFAGLKRW